MADLTFSSYAQGPLGEAITQPENLATLATPTFAPGVTLIGPGAEHDQVHGPAMTLLGPGHVAGIAPGTVLRMEPPPGATDVEPNFLAALELTPVELPWVLTPASAAGGRLRPWLVLVVLEASGSVPVEARPLPYVDAAVAELPDLADSWAWAHVQRSTGPGTLPGGAAPTAAALARLVCPRRLSRGVTYRACLVPAFRSGVAAGLDEPLAAELPHARAWEVTDAGPVRLPLFHHWTFTTGPEGDFEDLVTRLQPADVESLRVSSARTVDVRQPWLDDEALTEAPQLIGVQGALAPFAAPPTPEPAAAPDVLATISTRLEAQLDAPARRVREGSGEDRTGALSPPLYGARHLAQEETRGGQPWVAELNVSVANRVAAGLGAEYVRVHQEELMARAWEQVGAIREANRLRATVELTTAVAERIHERHVAALQPGELVAFAAPARARTRTSVDTTLAMELQVSRLVDGAESAAFARRIRPAGKLSRRTGVRVEDLVPRGLAGEVTVPAGADVVPGTPQLGEAGVDSVAASATAGQLMVMDAMVTVAALGGAAGGEGLSTRLEAVGMDEGLAMLVHAGSVRDIASMIESSVSSVTEVTASILSVMAVDPQFDAVSAAGVAIPADQMADRVATALEPGESHWARLASQTQVPDQLGTEAVQVMAHPDFPLPTALTLLDSDPEWFLPGLGALPNNRVALLQQNEPFIESYLAGLNHEMMRELLWREFPTDRRGTPFTRFWPRPGGSPDIGPMHHWNDGGALGSHLLGDSALAVLLVRGDVLRRYPGVVVTAIRSGAPDDSGAHRPDPAAPMVAPSFVIRVDEITNAYAFDINEAELRASATAAAPGWFFVFAEHGFRIRFGFDEPPEQGQASFGDWQDATWPPVDRDAGPGAVPFVRGHAFASTRWEAPAGAAAAWDKDAADVARVALQRPFRVAVQADLLVQPPDGIL